jgi:hypothetical protein
VDVVSLWDADSTVYRITNECRAELDDVGYLLHILYKYEFYVPLTALISPEDFSERRLRTTDRKGTAEQ